MLLSRTAFLAFAIGVLYLSTGAVVGQEFPNKNIRIVTNALGGGSDIAARIIAQGISGPLGQAVIVDNRPGVTGQETVAKAPPDGYTLLVSGGNHWTLPLLQTAPYDPVKDFSPITLVALVPNILTVHPSLPVKSVNELIALAKARPGQLNYAAGNSGSSAHLAGELFKSMTGVNMVMIPYKGTGPALNDLIGGQVQLMFATATSVTPHIKSGRLRGLAITSAQPSALVPGMPTIAASGVPGYESGSMTGISAPAKTPANVVNRLNQEVVRTLNRADVKENFLNIGLEAVGSTPEAFAATVKAEMSRLSKVIKDAGIKAD